MTDAVVAEAGRFVGQRVSRREDRRLLTGRGSYVDDVVLPGTLHLAFVRSDVARGRIMRLDATAARALSGVHAVYTAAELNARMGPTWTDMSGPDAVQAPHRVFADGDVRYVGEPIAAVVATSRYLAEDACELIEVDIEPAPAAVGIDDAARGDVIVHPERGTNVVATIAPRDDAALDAVFAAAPHVFTETFAQHRYLCVPMETRGILASWSPVAEEMQVWASTQSVHGLRSFTGRFLGVPEHRIRVVARDVGGGFGQKAFVMREEWTVLLATHDLGRPVKWIEDRRENLVAGQHAREERITVSAAVDDDGGILALKEHWEENVGAYPFSGTGAMAGMAATFATGPYRVPKLGVSAAAYYTNTCGRCAYRGPWLGETVAREQMVDRIAAALGVDPLELRRRNVLRAEDQPYTLPSRIVLDDLTVAETLEQAASLVGYDELRARQVDARADGRYLGIGLSLSIEPSGLGGGVKGAEAATIRVEPGGKVFCFMGSTSHGHSLETTMAQVVAETLGCDFDDVTIVQGDSTASPYGMGTGGSRSAPIGGAVAQLAATAVREKLLRLAAHEMEASPDDLEIERGIISVRGTPSRSTTLATVARKAYVDNFALPSDIEPGLEATARFKAPMFTWTPACHACVVEVDPVTGEVTILRYVVSEDCGRMINPMVVEGQIAGGVVQGVGGVLLEHMVYDERGNPLSTTFLDYLLPTAADVPDIEYGHIETPSSSPGGFRGMGEGGAIASPPAVVNAVADALAPFGVRVHAQPLGPVRLFELMAERDGS
jgi:carbon-monoxide dehydrogenase large subunit